MIRIAYENKLDEALDLAATNVDNDSSVNNLWHPYLEHALYCTQTNTTITGRWASAQRITCIAVGYHTANACTIKLYDSSKTLLLTKVVTLEIADAIYYLDAAVEGVFYFELAFTSAEEIRIGYIYLGQCHEFPSIEREGKYSYTFTSEQGSSGGGQRYGSYGTVLKKQSVNFPRFNDTDRQAFYDYINAVQNIKPHMVDLFPDSHESEPALYCTINSNMIDFTKRWESGFWYSVPFEWMEAR